MDKVFLTVLLCVSCSAISWAQDQYSVGDQGATAPILRAPYNNAIVQENTLPSGKILVEDNGKFHYKGSVGCSECHIEAAALKKKDNVVAFVSLNEFQVWLNDDPHSTAYLSIIPDRDHFQAIHRRLDEWSTIVNNKAEKPVVIRAWSESNELSRNILKQMFADDYDSKIGDLFRDVTDLQNSAENQLHNKLARFAPRLKATLQQCLNCHAGWDKRQEQFDPEIFEIGTGVSCESCHGTASSEWLSQHKEPEWRKKNPRDKETNYGQLDVRNPISRADLCFSCHIGNVDQGKVVTHEMYAAGHPPLPGIEIESFADQLPRHWRYLSEKKSNFTFAEDFKQYYGLNLRSGEPVQWTSVEYPRTKNLLVGGVIAAACSVDLLAKSAEKHTNERQLLPAGDPHLADLKSPWPEFAAFDCAACHHDLKAGGGVWQRGFAGIPGRPPAPYWPRPLAILAVAYLNEKQGGRCARWFDEFNSQQQKFQDVLDSQPFGKPTELSSQGLDYSRWLRKKVANEIQVMPLTRNDAIFVLKLLIGNQQNAIFNPEVETRDFHTARQLAWAINLVFSEVMQSERNTGKYQLGTDFQVTDNSIASSLRRMHELLLLDQPKTGQITTQQENFLTAWRDFDRKEFLKALNSLREGVNSIELQNQGANAAESNQIGNTRR